MMIKNHLSKLLLLMFVVDKYQFKVQVIRVIITLNCLDCLQLPLVHQQ